MTTINQLADRASLAADAIGGAGTAGPMTSREFLGSGSKVRGRGAYVSGIAEHALYKARSELRIDKARCLLSYEP